MMVHGSHHHNGLSLDLLFAVVEHFLTMTYFELLLKDRMKYHLVEILDMIERSRAGSGVQIRWNYLSGCLGQVVDTAVAV
jgi:hypothetical protein